MLLAQPGTVTAVVGANGSGKSALGAWLQTNTPGTPVGRLLAHRRLWFEHAGPDITSAQRQEITSSLLHWSLQLDSRWRDYANAQRAGIVLFDLLARVNERNARLAALVDDGATADEARTQVEASLLDQLNGLLGDAGLPVRIALTTQATFDAVHTSAGIRYPISQMSDGEKSALLLAAEVLTASPASVLILDEPERHLHRRISAPIIEAVIAARSDCHFVVLTHDLDLAGTLPKQQTTVIALSEMSWEGDQPVAWDAHVVDPCRGLPEAARRAVLGGRRELLFVEGDVASRDIRLLSLLFPEWSLVPAGGCDQVIRAVTGLSASADHHWVKARGVVDGDGRSAEERQALIARGVLALPVSEVESLYYSPDVIDAVAKSQADRLERASEELSAMAKESALRAITSGDVTRLAATVSEAVIHRSAHTTLPDRSTISVAGDEVQVTVASPYADQLARLQHLVESGDLKTIVAEYPIRDTGLRGRVTKVLGFQRPSHYEATVRSLVRADPSLRGVLRQSIGEIP